MLSEALRNVAKHASPSCLEVRVSRDDDTFTLELQNDGVHDRVRGTGMGLRLAAFEALQHEGVVEFGPTEADRWRVRLVVPLRRQDKGTLRDWAEAYDHGHVNVSGEPAVVKLVGNVIERQLARSGGRA